MTETWFDLVPRQQLPRTTAPFRGETLHSFLRRLAAVNHITVTDLQPLLGSTTGKRPDPRWLSIVTGWPVAALVDRLRGLTEPEPRHRFPSALCRLCAARRNVFDTVIVYPDGHVNVCRRHRLWIGGSHTAPQYDITPLPELRTAQRTHRRLARRHGTLAAEAAYRDATSIIRRWTDSGQHTSHRDRRLRICFPDRPERPGWPETEMADYPEVVALTALLISDTWTSKAVSLGPRKNTLRQFYTEVGRRLDLDIRFDNIDDPLVSWVNEQQHALELQRYRSDPTGTRRRPLASRIWREHQQAVLPHS
ncbi:MULTISPECIES: TniQ family protein [unclassified Rhodococcus (in: high G+C Gram-positive bacteria)]|uniref:TniQ family protein n=1 Tax=unclassified Rhodococcus (in: high G+C Gram-positive bacteria) TaxID=192944 RepID=UPI001386E281|nr:TniQ family protein [Rhodococcus sp. AH-ZY2]NCL77129.1 hypothetical protein [Rhodococcus sp. YH1]NCL78889.1 hypothetical protein [Rhodococcus sp. YH1]WML60905.1 TniQ family protein [Rhodococcus sp. AH-ZY2]